MFLCDDGVTYIDTPSNYSQHPNFITSWKMNRKAIKPCRSSFLHIINKNLQKDRRAILSIFVGIASLMTYSKFCNLTTSWKKMFKTSKKKPCRKFFHHNIDTYIQKEVKLGLQFPFNLLLIIWPWSFEKVCCYQKLWNVTKALFVRNFFPWQK